jgi:hypothetical protein
VLKQAEIHVTERSGLIHEAAQKAIGADYGKIRAIRDVTLRCTGRSPSDSVIAD